MDSLYKAFEPYLRGYIVDVGCGSGDWLIYLKNKGHDSLFGIDPDENNIKILGNNRIIGESVLLENILVFMDDYNFDTICSIDVLDTFVNRHGLLRCMEGLMHRKSKLLVRTKNLEAIEHLNNIFDLVEKIDETKYVFKKKQLEL